ncbi:DUF4172 domain-containing protein [Lunatimonas lonarensis]|nr:DUF4172 domain-containing protein [Lunatimonas lonarensis]
MTLDVLNPSGIEGEIPNPDHVRSSLTRRLGMDIAGAVEADRHVEGIVDVILDATQKEAAGGRGTTYKLIGMPMGS